MRETTKRTKMSFQEHCYQIIGSDKSTKFSKIASTGKPLIAAFVKEKILDIMMDIMGTAGNTDI
jgi:hypothetical protein